MDKLIDNQDVLGTRRARIFFALAGVMITSYLTANLMAVKLVSVLGVTMFDAGTITFPISYLLGDVVTEVYGFKNARRLIFLTFFCNIFLVGATSLGLVLPAPDYMAETAAAYAAVFSLVPRILLASLVAFCVGELLNAWTMVVIKRWTAGRHLWLRTIGSSAFGYLADTVLFVLIAFAGEAPARDLATMIAAQYALKMAIETVCATPLAYGLVRWIGADAKGETAP